jgi:hypothetical protein
VLGGKSDVVFVFDSVCTSAKAEVLCHLFECTAVELVDTQKQEGGVDCGLFAIAVATGIAFGLDPTLHSVFLREK